MKKLFTLLSLLLAVAVNGMAQNTWTVVGSAAALNGTNDWDVDCTDNDLENLLEDDGLLMGDLTVENCVLVKGVTYQYKVVKNHSWGQGSLPEGDNATFTVDKTGIYTVSYGIIFDTYDPSNLEYCKINCTKTGDIPYSIAGDNTALFGAEWDEKNALTNMVKDGDVYKWTSPEVDLTEGSVIQFKVVGNHTWAISYGDGTKNFYKEIPADGNYKLIITFNPETEAITAMFEGESHKYIVAGSSAITTSADDWVVSDVSEMTVDGNVATLSLENLDLSAGDYEYKIVHQMFIKGVQIGSDVWYGDPDKGGDANYGLNVPKNSKYNINYSFDLTTGKATATATEQFTGYYLVRSDNNWKASGDPLTTKPEHLGSYFAVIDNQPGLSFIVAPNTALKADDTVADWNACKRPATNKTLGFGNFEGEYKTGGEENWTIENNGDRKNDGILTIEIQDSKWVITCNQTIPMTSAGYATYSNIYDYSIYNGTPYIVKKVGEAVKLEKVANPSHIPGGTGVVVAKEGDNNKFYVFGPSGDVSDVSGNLLIGSNNYDYEITGSDGVKNYTPYIFANGSNGVGFYLIKNYNHTQTIAPHKAFLALPEGAGAREFISLFDEGEATGISASLNEKGEMTNEKVFNLSGQRVSQPTKGLYIVNGKKFVK